jgi:hypothetical protein
LTRCTGTSDGKPKYIELEMKNLDGMLAIGSPSDEWPRTDRATIAIFDTSKEAELCLLKIKAFLLERKRFLQAMRSPMPMLIPCAVAFACVFVLRHFKSTIGDRAEIILGVAIVVAGLGMSWRMLFHSPSVLDLQPKSDDRSFWERNKDDLAKLLVGGVIGAFLQWMGSHFLK